jgi:hypothetical protein
MKHIKGIIGIFVFLVLVSPAYCAMRNVVVEIDYGGVQQNRKVEIPWKQGVTALEALQSVAKTETRKIGENLLITSIDGVEGQTGVKAWYYDINGKRATSFANKCILSEGDRMRWTYTKDVCSAGRSE